MSIGRLQVLKLATGTNRNPGRYLSALTVVSIYAPWLNHGRGGHLPAGSAKELYPGVVGPLRY